MYIGHLVSLERSNFAMLLGSSGVVRSSENPLKMFVFANTHAHGVVHVVVLAHFQRRSVGVDVDQLAGKRNDGRTVRPCWADGPPL